MLITYLFIYVFVLLVRWSWLCWKWVLTITGPLSKTKSTTTVLIYEIQYNRPYNYLKSQGKEFINCISLHESCNVTNKVEVKSINNGTLIAWLFVLFSQWSIILSYCLYMYMRLFDLISKVYISMLLWAVYSIKNVEKTNF